MGGPGGERRVSAVSSSGQGAGQNSAAACDQGSRRSSGSRGVLNLSIIAFFPRCSHRLHPVSAWPILTLSPAPPSSSTHSLATMQTVAVRASSVAVRASAQPQKSQPQRVQVGLRAHQHADRPSPGSWLGLWIDLTGRRPSPTRWGSGWRSSLPHSADLLGAAIAPSRRRFWRCWQCASNFHPAGRCSLQAAPRKAPLAAAALALAAAVMVNAAPADAADVKSVVCASNPTAKVSRSTTHSSSRL